MKVFKFLLLSIILFAGVLRAQSLVTNVPLKVAWDYYLAHLEPNMTFNVYKFGLNEQKINVGILDSSIRPPATNGVVTFMLSINLEPGTNTLVVTAFSPFTKLESFDSERLFLPSIPKDTVVKIVKIQ